MRPELTKDLDPEIFLAYYWLKEELCRFCRRHGIPASGNKDGLTARIHAYLKDGTISAGIRTVIPAERKQADSPLSPDSPIPEGYRNDERHRTFFLDHIGEHFKFNVPFMDWMKANAGKRYHEAIAEWERIDADKKAGKKRQIGPQFQYNQYTRDFFAANPDQEAIGMNLLISLH